MRLPSFSLLRLLQRRLLGQTPKSATKEPAKKLAQASSQSRSISDFDAKISSNPNKRKLSRLIAGTAGGATALVSTLSYSQKSPNINLNLDLSQVSQLLSYENLVLRENKKKSAQKKRDIFENVFNLPLFSPDMNDIDFKSFASSRNEAQELRFIYNSARQCRLLCNVTKDDVVAWLEHEVRLHNQRMQHFASDTPNISINAKNGANIENASKNSPTATIASDASDANDVMELERDSVHVSNIEATGQKYIIYSVRNVGTGQRYQYILIRGTRNWKNLFCQLKSNLVFDKKFGMYLHSGYSNATHAILNDIKQHIDPNCKLRLVGHSYGGVLCTLLGYYLTCANETFDRIDSKGKNTWYDIESIVTFGMPEFADRDSCLNFIHNNANLPLLRVEHVNDYIARIDWNKYNHVKSGTYLKKFYKKGLNKNSFATGAMDRDVQQQHQHQQPQQQQQYEMNSNLSSNGLYYRSGSHNDIYYIGSEMDGTKGGNESKEEMKQESEGKRKKKLDSLVSFVSGRFDLEDSELANFLMASPSCVHRMKDYEGAINKQLMKWDDTKMRQNSGDKE